LIAINISPIFYVVSLLSFTITLSKFSNTSIVILFIEHTSSVFVSSTNLFESSGGAMSWFFPDWNLNILLISYGIFNWIFDVSTVVSNSSIVAMLG
jgi:hypothetical protein